VTEQPFRILGIPGSLRRYSYNKGLIRAAQAVAPEGVEVEMYLLDDIPFMNEDVEAQGDPEPVVAFKNAIRNADALLIATPQYNGAPPAVLKNAIDWASRRKNEPDPRYSVIEGKPVAIVGATAGKSFTEPAQIELRRILKHVRADVMEEPQVKLGRANERFAENPELPDQETLDIIRETLDALVAYARQRSAEKAAAD
jgi:chromate reductase